jgi:hypothetical protein
MPIPTTAPPQRHYELLCGIQATALGDQAAVPPQDGTWGDQPMHPQPSRQEPDQRSEDDAVGPVQAGPRIGAAQHGDLVPQHEQLRVLGRWRTAEQHNPAADPDEDQIEQTEGHGRSSCPAAAPGASLQLTGPGRLLAPHREDIDFDAGTIQVRRQLQRIRGELLLASVKTHAGQRDLPLLDLARQALKLQAAQQAAYRADMGSAWPETGLVFTTRTGRPVEPRNLVRSFRRICDANKIRLIKVHHLRHTVGSLLKDLKVPVRDAQTILGHTRISTTLEIYTLTDEPARRDALTRLHGLLDQGQG